jgi:uncharacterized BrkB/YihY/UPF0761 family membrane protein
MNAVWNIPRKDRPNYWFRLARGLGSLLLLVVFVFAATALAQLGRIGSGIAGRLLPFAGSLLLNLLLMLALFQVLTGMWVRWRRLLPGAVCGAVGWTALQTLGVFIVDRQLERVLAALAETEERRPEQTIEVSFAPEPDGRQDPPPPAGRGTR